MRRASVLLTAGVAAALAFPLPTVSAAPIPAATPAGPVLTSVALSSGAVSVSGLETVTVTATVTTTGETGACIASGSDGFVLLTRTSKRVWDPSAWGALVGGMSCVSDSGGVRTRRADVVVPSTADGPWRVDDVDFGNSIDLDPRSFGLPDATLAVTGAHRPRLRLSVRPQPLRYPVREVRVTVQATYDDTGAPVTTRWIGITDDFAARGGCGGCAGNTDSNGRIVRWLNVTDLRRVIAYMPLSAGAPYDWALSYSQLDAPIVVQPALTAAPANRRLRHGTNVDINGRVVAIGVTSWPFPSRIRLGLQRLVGRHWRTVSGGTIRPNGRFTLGATPPKGRNLYRVGLPRQQAFASATSRTFVIRGT